MHLLALFAAPAALLAVFGASVVSFDRPQDDAVALTRAFDKGAPLRFRSVHSETYAVDGEGAAALRYHGDASFDALAAASTTAGSFDLKPSYTDVTANWWEGAAKDPFASHALTKALVEWKDGKTTLAKDRVVDAPTNWPNVLGADWYANEALLRRLATALSAGDGPWSTQARLNFAFPPLPTDALKKGDRYDADYVVGYLGSEAQVQVFYTSVLESFDAKSATFTQSGRAKLVKFEKPASRRADGIVMDVVEDASTFSARVVISRKDGAILSREGELALTLKASDPAKPDAAPVVSHAKIWTKIERR